MVQLAEYAQVTSPDFRGDLQRPESWLSHRGEMLRELPGRRVFRSTINGQPVVIKEYAPRERGGGFLRLGLLKNLLRPYARTEAENALAVLTRGVPVVEPLAHGRLADGRQILVLRDVEGARTLQDIVANGSVRGGERHRLAKSVGELFARMQNAGIRHGDPHAGNVLVRPDGRVLLADAHDLKPGDYLTPEERAKDVATFALFFLTHASTVDLLLFWGAYGRASTLQPEDLEALRERVATSIPVAFRRLVGTRTRKTRRTGQPVRVGRFAGLDFAGLPAATLETIAGHAANLEPGPHVIKQSPTAWTLAVDDWIVKVFLPKKMSRAVRDLVQGTRAERAVGAAEALRHRGLETPRIGAVLRDTQSPRSVLVMERLRDARPIDEAIATLGPGDARRVAVQIGRTLRRMHDWGLRHRDLKRDNVFLTDEGRRLCFLDLDGVRQQRSGPLDWDRRERDLANLAGSLLDRNLVPTGLQLRTLDAYLGGVPRPGFARDVIRRANAARARRLER